jgi:hypothetical protein
MGDSRPARWYRDGRPRAPAGASGEARARRRRRPRPRAGRAALAAHGGNVSRAARSLGISRSTLYRRCLTEHPRTACGFGDPEFGLRAPVSTAISHAVSIAWRALSDAGGAGGPWRQCQPGGAQPRDQPQHALSAVPDGRRGRDGAGGHALGQGVEVQHLARLGQGRQRLQATGCASPRCATGPTAPPWCASSGPAPTARPAP